MQASARRTIAAAALAIAAAYGGAASAQVRSQLTPMPPPLPERAGEITGKFNIRYIPIMCVRAPCPPGRYSITMDNQPVGTVQAVIFFTTVDGVTTSTSYTGRYLPDDNGVEGTLLIDGATARIEVSRFGQGQWKP